MKPEILSQAKEAYKLAFELKISAAERDKRFSDAIQPLFSAILHGYAEALENLGVSCWCSNNPDYQKQGLYYLRAAIIHNDNPFAWLNLAKIHLTKNQTLRMKKDSQLAECETELAWISLQNSDWLNAEQKEKLDSNIFELAKKNFRVASPYTFTFVRTNSLDRFWAFLPSFWSYFYGKSPLLAEQLKSCFSAKTKSRFLMTTHDFEKKAMAWQQLFHHFSWDIVPLYLFYVENSLNTPEFMAVISKVISSIGYTIKLCRWDDFDEKIPDNAVVATLADVSFLSENFKQYAAYQLLMDYKGVKLWIYYQIPYDSSNKLKFNLSAISEYWKSWKQLYFSLLDHPVLLFLSSQGLMPYLIKQSCVDSIKPLLDYLRDRTVFGKKFYDIYSENDKNHLSKLSVLWPEIHFSRDKDYLYLDKLHSLEAVASQLYEYLAIKDDGSFFLTLTIDHAQLLNQISSCDLTIKKICESNMVFDCRSLSSALAKLKVDNDQYKRLNNLAWSAIDQFKLLQNRLSLISELCFFAHSKNPELIETIFWLFSDMINQLTLMREELKIELLRSLVLLLSQNELTLKKANDFLLILKVMMKFLGEVDIQQKEEDIVYHLLCFIGFLLLRMHRIGGERWQIQQESQEAYMKQLEALKKYASPMLVNVIDWVWVALQKIQNNETNIGTVLRIGKKSINCIFGVIRLIEPISSIKEIESVVSSGENVFSCSIELIRDVGRIIPFGKNWYDNLNKFNTYLSQAMHSSEEKCLDDSKKFLQSVLENEQHIPFIYGAIQFVDIFINSNQIPASRIDGVYFLGNIYEWSNALAYSYDKDVADCLLKYLESYGDDNCISESAVKVKEIVNQIQQERASEPLTASNAKKEVSAHVAGFWRTANRSITVKTNEEWGVQAKQYTKPTGKLFEMAFKRQCELELLNLKPMRQPNLS